MALSISTKYNKATQKVEIEGAGSALLTKKQPSCPWKQGVSSGTGRDPRGASPAAGGRTSHLPAPQLWGLEPIIVPDFCGWQTREFDDFFIFLSTFIPPEKDVHILQAQGERVLPS